MRQIFALPIYEVLMPSEVVGLDDLAHLGEALFGETDPTARLSREEPLRFYVEGDRHMLSLRVSGVTGEGAELEKHGDELSIRLGNSRRVVPLPQYLAGLQPVWAQVQGDRLVVAFEEPRAGQ